MEEKVEQPVEEPVEEPQVENVKITVPPKKKEKDPKRVAQGKRLSQISEGCKKKKMRREMESENQIEFSVNYKSLLYFGVPTVVFAGFYLYFSNKNQKLLETKKDDEPTKKQPVSAPKTASRHVSLFD